MSIQEPINPPVEVVRYSIPADSSLVGQLRDCFTATLAGGGLGEPELIQWQLVFSELVFNAIDHGAKGDPSRTVTVEWCLTQDAVILAAQDPGTGPPEEWLKSPTLPDDPTAESGRGLYIIASFADELHPWRGPHGFCLEVVKHYPNRGLTLPGSPEIDSILDELSACYESLSVFHRLTENLIGSANLRDFIGSSLDDFLSLHPLDRILFLGSPDIPETLRKILSPADWFLDRELADPTLKALGDLSRETVWQDHEDLTRQIPSFRMRRAVGGGCVFPIVAGDIHFGTLIVLRKTVVTDSKLRSLGTLRTLADLCGIACANAHLANIRDEAQKDLRELEIAVEIQKALLPILPAPVSDRWLVSIYQESSLTIAGDYAMARTDPAGNLVVAMIDVMGKGVSAALLASIFRTAFDLSLRIPSASGILETINCTLCNQLGDLSMFITCSIARVTADGRALEHASAGHCPTFLYQADGSLSFLQPSGPPLGILPTVRYTSDTVALSGGERLVFVTDGCYEWDRLRDDSGWQRFVEYLSQDRTAPPPELWAHLCDRIHRQHGPQLEDDCTIITLDVLP
jgi:serine phosphatase RsbU (regulator of sigma subunit)/anti-sigma regulatory factor (Ser/Thr protein kinase)